MKKKTLNILIITVLTLSLTNFIIVLIDVLKFLPADFNFTVGWKTALLASTIRASFSCLISIIITIFCILLMCKINIIEIKTYSGDFKEWYEKMRNERKQLKLAKKKAKLQKQLDEINEKDSE
jgi:uncharacterized membrane protein YfbV (UPF0208 family)